MTMIAELARRASDFAVKNSPTILTTIGVIGTVSTAILAGRASFQAADIIRLKEASDDERGAIGGTPREVMEERVKLVWKLYIPAATMGVATVACVIGANRVGARRAAGLAAAYSIIERNFDDFKDKVQEKIGEKKTEAIHDEIAQDRVDQVTYPDDVKLSGLDEGQLCLDMFGDRRFRHTYEGIRAAENDLNHNLIHNGTATLADFYSHLGLDAPPFSEELGWNADRMLEVRLSSVLREGLPWIAMSFKNDPRPNYGRFH